MCGKFRNFAAVLYKRDDDAPPRRTYKAAIKREQSKRACYAEREQLRP